MGNFPFFNFPYRNYNNYRNYYNYYRAYPNFVNHSNTNVQVPLDKSSQQEPARSNSSLKDYSQKGGSQKEDVKKRSSNHTSFGPVYFNPDSFFNTEESVLEVLGLSLYLDDLIILGLLFFLYNEGVKDDLLFISLLLLLLS